MLNDKYFDTFTMFTWEHYIPVLIVLFIVALIFFFRQSLIESKSKYTIGLILVGVTLGLEILINMWRVYAGAWSVTTSLPLHLSSFSAYLSMYLLLTRRQKLFNVTFFLMMIGALLALVTPGIQGNWGFPHFRYFQFFAIHGMLVINVAYMLFVYQFSEAIRYKHIWLNALSLLVLAAILFPLNLILDSNYLFLMAKPGPNTAFDLFGPWPWYLINIAWAGVPIFFHLFYVPFYLAQKHDKSAVTRVKSEI
mgnify:CR=1 FL=1